jgi:hypothetical protein
MTGRRLGISTALLGALAVLTALGGCGTISSTARSPTLGQLPLLPGSQIVAQAKACDQGPNAFCAIDLVVVNRRYRSSDILARDQSHELRKRGWSLSRGDTDLQSGANSPGHKLRLTFATASGDLREIDLGLIGRPWPITYALSTSMFDRAAAMSMMLEVGAS